MAKLYKVWIIVEEFDVEEECGEEMYSGFGCTAVFDAEKPAQAFAQQLHDKYTDGKDDE